MEQNSIFPSPYKQSSLTKSQCKAVGCTAICLNCPAHCIHGYRLVLESLKCLVRSQALLTQRRRLIKCRYPMSARPTNVGRAYLDRPPPRPKPRAHLVAYYGYFLPTIALCQHETRESRKGCRRGGPIFTCHFLSFGTSTCKS